MEGRIRSILAKTASFGQKVCFCQIPKLTKAEILKPKLISAKIFGQNGTEMIFGCPLGYRNRTCYLNRGNSVQVLPDGGSAPCDVERRDRLAAALSHLLGPLGHG